MNLSGEILSTLLTPPHSVVEAAALPCRHYMTDAKLCLLQDACHIFA
jgi:hypothetical protein